MMILLNQIKTNPREFVLQEANGCDNEIQELRGHQVELSQQLEDKQVNVQHMQSQSDTLDGDIERLFEIKQKVSQPITRILTSCESADQQHSCILQENSH